MDETLSFPDGPRGELDRALGDLVHKAQDVLAVQGRLRALLRANQAVVEQLDLAVVLRRITEAAVELVGAEYGALGVNSPSGGLEQFIHVGISPELADRIGQLPEGRGLLGALIDDPNPIRLDRIGDDPRSSGFPANHPPMDTFLGVPVRVRGEVFGALYLSNRAEGSFTAEDEQLISSLAASAGIAIENARLFAETKRRQAWAGASAEVAATLLSASSADAVSILAQRVLALADADLVTVVVPVEGSDDVLVQVACGVGSEDLQGRTIAAADSLAGLVLEGGQPIVAGEGHRTDPAARGRDSIGPVMALPLASGGGITGVLVVERRPGGARFDASDLEMAADFAGQATVAIELGRAREDQMRMTVLEDRGRIARDLHDHVIQQLFGTGLELQNIAAGSTDRAAAERLARTVGNLDAAISQIRTAIFALSTPSGTDQDSLRHRLIDLANDVAIGLHRPPTVTFSGPVDLVVEGNLAEDVVAVAREALTNVAKHAEASEVSLAVSTADRWVIVTVADDGRGFGDPIRRSGLANLKARAELHGGAFAIESGAQGTTLTWRARL